MTEEIKQNREDSPGSSRANAEIHDSTGRVLAITAFGIACIALGAAIPGYFQSRDTRAELLQEIQRSESRVIADNREKTTAYTLLDNHVKELENRVKVQETLNVRQR